MLRFVADHRIVPVIDQSFALDQGCGGASAVVGGGTNGQDHTASWFNPLIKNWL